jgi:hypothetical protein
MFENGFLILWVIKSNENIFNRNHFSAAKLSPVKGIQECRFHWHAEMYKRLSKRQKTLLIAAGARRNFRIRKTPV